MYSAVLDNLFSRSMLRSCIANEPSENYLYAANTFLENAGSMTNREVVQGLYRVLMSTHRNEYIYKNTLLNRIVVGRHSPRTSTAFTEVPVCGSIADFLIINGKATAYEIKTDLDKLDRLDMQLKDYQKAFDRVCIVCGARHLPALLKRYADSPVGIIEMTNRQHLSTKKEAEPYKESLSHEAIFRLLRKKEYERVLVDCGLRVPNPKSFYYYRDCLAEFGLAPLDVAYPSVLAALKQRGKDVEVTALKAVPNELKSLGYFMRISLPQSERLASFLEAPLASMEVCR